MNIWLRVLLYVHITSVILSLGPFFVLIPMVRKLRSAPSDLHEAHLDIFRIAIRLAKHAGHVLVGTGILMVMIGKFPWTTSWILLTIIILVASLFFLARAFSPTIRKLSQGTETKGTALRKLSRSIWIYIFLLMFMLWLMVTKPLLWS